MLIIKCLMLKIKNLTLLSPKKLKKGREFWPRFAEKNRALLDFFCNLDNLALRH